MLPDVSAAGEFGRLLGPVGMSLEELKARQSAVWSSAPWERAEHLLASVHDALVEALAPAAGERWLDVATGTGAVALRAARAGAQVTGVDFAPGLVETARRRAAEEGLAVRFDLGDAERLPYADGSCDVLASSMGLIFAPDHRAVAGEVVRLVAPGGRLGFTAWRGSVPFAPVTQRYAPPLEPGQGDSAEWGRKEYVEELLGASFELGFRVEPTMLAGESPRELWALVSEAIGPVRALRRSLVEPGEAAQLEREFLEFFETHRNVDGVRVPGEYLLVLGRRR